jgi:hypothetical protein
VVTDDVVGDLEQPGGQARAALEAAQPAVHHRPDLLGQVLSVAGAGQAHHHPVDVVEVLGIDRVEVEDHRLGQRRHALLVGQLGPGWTLAACTHAVQAAASAILRASMTAGPVRLSFSAFGGRLQCAVGQDTLSHKAYLPSTRRACWRRRASWSRCSPVATARAP